MNEADSQSRRWSWIAAEVGDLGEALARRHGRSAAIDDAVQEACLRAAMAKTEPRPSDRVGWLRRIADHVRVDEWRRTRRSVELREATDLRLEGVPSDDALDLRDALLRLRKSDRELLSALARGYSYGELARHFGLEPAAIRQRALRARLRLLHAWQGGGS